MNKRNTDRLYCAYCQGRALRVSRCDLTLVLQALSSFNQLSRSDTAAQFPDAQSLSALALSAAFKLLLADALLFNLPSQSLSTKPAHTTFPDVIFH